MNARERFQRIMRYEPVDRLPVMALETYYELPTLARWRQDGDLPEGKVPEDILDMDRLDNVPAYFAPVPAYKPRVIAEDADSITDIDWMGTTVRRLKSAPTMYYGHIDHPVKNREDWLRYRERFLASSPERTIPDAEIVRLNTSTNPVVLQLFPFFFRLGFYSMGMTPFMLAFYDTPDLVHEMFSFWSDFTLKVIRPFLGRLKIDAVAFVEDLAYKSGPHLAPQIYRDFWLPYQVPIVEAVRKAGVPVVNCWTSGNLDALIPMLLEHGINSTFICDRNSNMDPYRLRKQYGKDLLLGGGFPKDPLIKGPAAIDREIEYLMPMIRSGGFIPALDDVVPPEVPFSHFRHYIARLREITL